MDGTTAIDEANRYWLDVEADWTCPGCRRSRDQVPRRAKSGRVVAKLVEHYCHSDSIIEDYCLTHWPGGKGDDYASEHQAFVRERIGPLIRRFQPILVCEDRNNADGAAKKLVGASSWFSFAPNEIRWFVRSEPHRAHAIDASRVREVYDYTIGRYGELLAHADAILRWMLADTTGTSVGLYWKDSLALLGLPPMP